MQNKIPSEIECNESSSDISELTGDFYPQQQTTIIEPANQATLRTLPIRSSYLAKNQSGITEETKEGEEGSDHVMETPRRLRQDSEEENSCCLCLDIRDALSSCCSILNVFRTSQTLIIPAFLNQNPDNINLQDPSLPTYKPFST